MTLIPGIDVAQEFVNRHSTAKLFSTGAKKIEFTGDLYNVSGSTTDPKEVPGHKGSSWKKLLIEVAELKDSSCYVTEPPPEGKGKSHPGFNVGGHMTENSDNTVTNGICQLMPLCSWHNNKAQNELKYSVSKKVMVELTGYMEGDTAATFLSRSGIEIASEQFGMAFFNFEEKAWQSTSIDKDALNSKAITTLSGTPGESCYIIFERLSDGFFKIKEANLPAVDSTI